MSLSGDRPTRMAPSPVRWLLPASGPDSMFSCAWGPASCIARSTGCVSADVAAGAGGGCQAGITVVDSCGAAISVRSAAGTGGGAGGAAIAAGGGGGGGGGGGATGAGGGAEAWGALHGEAGDGAAGSAGWLQPPAA